VLSHIESAWRWNKPAVLSTHRINYVSCLDKQNAKHGLNELQRLLNLIRQKHPDVEFISSEDLVNIIIEEKRVSK
jgi:hypothetical protein